MLNDIPGTTSGSAVLKSVLYYTFLSQAYVFKYQSGGREKSDMSQRFDTINGERASINTELWNPGITVTLYGRAQ